MNILRNKLLIAIVFICGCNSTQTNQETSLDNHQFDLKILNEISGKLDGEWYGEKYLNDIEKTKSIYANKDYKTKVFGFVLDKRNLLGETPVLNGFHDHEGGYGANLKFDQQKNIFINDLSKKSEFDAFPKPFELRLVKDDHLEMYFPETNEVDKYKKAKPNLQTELRKILIAGNYINLNDRSKVKFGKEGKISSWGEYVYYELAFDFFEGFEYDVIVFFKTTKGGNWKDVKIYKFSIDSDTLKLQLVEPNWETLEHKIIDEIYLLKKE